MAPVPETINFRIADLDVTRLLIFELSQVVRRLDDAHNPEADNMRRALERWSSNLRSDQP